MNVIYIRRYGEQCGYIHGEMCDMCGKAVLHPTHVEQRSCHAYVSLT